MLIICPECGKQISDHAMVCPNCGFPMHEHLRKVADEHEGHSLIEPERKGEESQVDHAKIVSGKKPIMDKNEKILISVVAIVMLLIFVIVIPVISSTPAGSATPEKTTITQVATPKATAKPSPSSKPSAKKYYTEDEIKSALYVYATDFVKGKLKSPSSAKFPVMSKCVYEKGTDNVHMMAGTVEAENAFGATLQETWAIMVSIEDGKIHFIFGQIGEEQYFS